MLFRGHKPGWLYEPLPYLYALTGVVTALFLRNIGGVLSGLLLVSAGGIIWKQRRDYRTQNAFGRSRTQGEDDFSSDGGTALVRVVWRPSFEVGHELIDRQHRRLFSLGNALIEALVSKSPQADVELMLDELVKDIGNHFQSEEEIMASHNAPISIAHKEIHGSLLERIKALQEKFHLGKLPAGELVGFIAYDVVAQHILKEDLKFSSTLNSQ